MSEQPLTPETAFARLQAWFVESQELKELKQKEVIHRKELSAFYFTAPREGTNRLDLGQGYDLKLDFSYNYKVDEAELDNVAASQIKKLKLPWDDLFVFKPELSVSTYRKLTPEQKAFVDTLLVITDATPQLAIVPQTGTRTDVPVTPAAPAPAATELHIVEDMDEAVCGSYYEDGEGQWWLCTVFDPATQERDWEQVEDPRAPVEKPKRKPRTKKGA